MSREIIEQNPSLKYHVVIEALSRSLRQMGITFFAYTALDDLGNAYCLGSKADYAAEYLKRELANNDIHYRANTCSKQLHYHFWDFAALDKNAKALYRMAAEFDQGHTLTITRNDKLMTHCYHFSGRVSDVGLNQRYIDKLDILHAYIDFFQNCLIDVPEVSSIYQHPVKVANKQALEEKSVNIFTGDPRQMNLNEEAHSELRFKHLSRYYLTENERRCLYWLHRGKPSEMIAEILGVTRKTVERYVASIKEKYGCYTLFQLGQKITEHGITEFL